jgi:alpha-amylase/alpha-mannosidase (GH57 family)
MLKKHPKAKITVNICGVLTQMLSEHNGNDVLDNFKLLAKNRQLEFVESAKYHAILALIPPEEAKRQIKLNQETNSYFFQNYYKPRGFFPPEMCYSASVAELVKDLGYEWILLSGISCTDAWPLDVIYKAKTGSSNIITFFRDDIVSNKVSFRSVDSIGFLASLLYLAKGKKDIYVITAMDAETFGHHIKNWEKLFLAKVYEFISAKKLSRKYKIRGSTKIKAVTISELLKKFSVRESKPPISSSWSTTKEDINKKDYYPLWKSPGNKLHALQWKHLRICFKFIDSASQINNNEQSKRYYNIAREILDKALHSCQFWWANKTRMYDINLINKGLILQEEALFNAYKSLILSDQPDKSKKKYYLKMLVARDIASKIRDRLYTN